MNPGDVLAQVLAEEGIAPDRLLHGLCRTLPVVALVPAFGLRASPGAARALFALGLAVAGGTVAGRPATLWGYGLSLSEGLVLGFASALPLWVATMVGGLWDQARGSVETSPFPTVEERVGPGSVLFSLLAALLFLGQGGLETVATALATGADSFQPGHASRLAVRGIAIAIAVGSPIVLAQVVMEVAGALIARAANPTQIGVLLSPIRSLMATAVIAISLPRMAAVLVRGIAGP